MIQPRRRTQSKEDEREETSMLTEYNITVETNYS